jgi:acyl carrier protein
VLIKHGKYTNEMSSYRYDVVLHIAAVDHIETGMALAGKGQWYDWAALNYSESQLQTQLTQTDRSWLGVNNIPNDRIASDAVILELLHGDNSTSSAEKLIQEAVVSISQRQALDPFRLEKLAEETGFQLEFSYSKSAGFDCMDVLFRRERREQCSGHVFWPMQEKVVEDVWSAFATNPLKGKLARAIVPHLKDELKLSLPTYMLPSYFVLLDSLPLSPNGKIDQKSLPDVFSSQTRSSHTIVEPETDTEKQLALIWDHVLANKMISINDDFFDIGGHSLLATQVMSRIRQQFDIELPLMEMFARPTINGLAEHIDQLRYSKQLMTESASSSDDGDDYEVSTI